MLSIIVAVANNNVIGKGNSLLWRIPNDLKRFKSLTTGHTIIMGRKTFQSLPGILPDRKHVILTRDKDFQPEGVIIFSNIEKLLASLEKNQEYFVIGGGEIYKQFINYADKIYLTKVYDEFQGDTFFPEIDYNEWNIVTEEQGILDSKNTIPHSFLNLERIV